MDKLQTIEIRPIWISIFDKKFLPLKFIRETLAIDDVKGKVDKEIIHTSIVKSAIKNTLSR